MNIQILHLIEGAKKAVGLTVIIDVFRAFTVACYVMNNGADSIIPVGDIELAHQLRANNPGSILIGERDGKIQPGFDYGNSPTQIQNIDFTGKTVIQTTSAGTQGIANSFVAEQIITGSLVNSGAIIEYILDQKPEKVSLVCMGNAGKSMAEEDVCCAEYIQKSLEGKAYDIHGAIESMKTTAGRRFFDMTNNAWAPESDFYLCTDISRFHFILKVEKTPNGLCFFKRKEMGTR